MVGFHKRHPSRDRPIADLIMWFDRFDILSAHYAFAAAHHGGQGSDLYFRLSRIGRYFTPGAAWRGYDSLSENGQAIYDDLAYRYGLVG